MNAIVKHPTHISITGYEIGECKRIENAYVYRENWAIHKVGITYDPDTKELRIFGGANIQFIQKLSGGLPVIIDPCYDPYKKIQIRLEAYPRSELQKNMIQFLIGSGDWDYTKHATQISCNAETGEGKTFCTIALMSFLKVRTMVIINREKIRQTWLSEIMNFTDLNEKNILVIDKGSILEDILNDEFDDKQYLAFLIVHRMLNTFASKYGWEAVHQVFLKLGIGLKIYDEAHMEFANTTMIDCYTHTAKTLYLTATPKLSNPKANFIYQHIFQTIPRFDQRALGYTDSKRHITMLCFMYDSHPDIDWKGRCFNSYRKCFVAKEHSIYQVTEDPYFMDIIEETIEKMAVKNKFRSIIFVSRILSCDIIADKLNKTFAGKIKAGSYHSKKSASEKEDIMKNCDVIVSTNASLGLGVTIDNLQFVFNCEAHRNLGDQSSGRLRRYGEGLQFYYAELVDCGFKSITKQWNSRRKHYREIFNEVITIDLRKGRF